jgi:hypothetical protein
LFWFSHYVISAISWIKRDRLDDKKYTSAKFKHTQGYELDWKNLRTLNEKIQWLKLYDRQPFHTTCADKLECRKYLVNKFNSDYLVPILFQSYSSNDVLKENMPDEPFILKANHDAGSFLIVRDKNTIDWKKVQVDAKRWLLRKYFYLDREWQYKNIKPSIIAEKLLVCKNGRIPNDYKLHVVSGKVEFIYVSIDREGQNTRNIYNTNWEALDFIWVAASKKLKKEKSKAGEVSRPETLSEMIRIAEDIAVDFPYYVRVDFYDVDGKLFFGEITQHHGGGFDIIRPFEIDLKYGDMITLPINS